MRIALDCLGPRSLLAGTATYMVNLANHLARIDAVNEYVAFCDDALARHLPHTGNFTVKSIGRWNTSRLSRAVWEQVCLPALVRKHEIDILHGLGHVLPLAKPRQRKYVVTIHDLTYWTHPAQHTRSRRTFMKLLIPPSLRRADAILAVSATTARDIRARFPYIPSSRTTVAHEGVGEAFKPSRRAESPAVLRTLGITRPYLLFVGTLEPRKNIGELITAFASLADDFPRHSLVLAGGKGWMYDSIFTQIRELGLESRTILPGYVPSEDLPALYAAADAFVYPSLYEGFGLPVLEAMASGCPVITSRAGSLPEIAGDAARFFTPGARGRASLATALREVLSRPAHRQALARKGLRRAKTFTWERTARLTKAVYEELHHAA